MLSDPLFHNKTSIHDVQIFIFTKYFHECMIDARCTSAEDISNGILWSKVLYFN